MPGDRRDPLAEVRDGWEPGPVWGAWLDGVASVGPRPGSVLARAPRGHVGASVSDDGAWEVFRYGVLPGVDIHGGLIGRSPKILRVGKADGPESALVECRAAWRALAFG